MGGWCQGSAVYLRLFINIILQGSISAASVSDKYQFGNAQILVFWSSECKVGAMFLLWRRPITGSGKFGCNLFPQPPLWEFPSSSISEQVWKITHSWYVRHLTFCKQECLKIQYYLAWDSHICFPQRICTEVSWNRREIFYFRGWGLDHRTGTVALESVP